MSDSSSIDRTMNEDDRKAAQSRIELLRKSGYPFSADFREAIQQSLGSTVEIPTSDDPFGEIADKDVLDRILVRWITSNDDNREDVALDELLALAFKYRHGDLDEADVKADGRTDYAFAKIVVDMWWMLCDAAPKSVADRHVDALSDAKDATSHFSTLDGAVEFLKRVRETRGQNGCHSMN